MTQMKLQDPTDGSSIGVDFQEIFNKIISIPEDKKERIASEDPASRTNSAIVSEVRGFLRKNLPELFKQNDEELKIDITKD